MRTALLALIIVLFASPVLASADTAAEWDNQVITISNPDAPGMLQSIRLALTERFNSGALDQILIDYHTDNSVKPAKLNEQAWEANVRAMRKHALCATRPKLCKTEFVL